MWADSDAVVVAGVGMQRWRKWNGDFVDYGRLAAQAALLDAGLGWSDVDFVSASAAVRSGYAGLVSAATVSQALGWRGTPITTNSGACASGAQAIDVAVSRIRAHRCDVALVLGVETGSQDALLPMKSDNEFDMNWLRYHTLGATNPVYLALNAQRRMALWGDTAFDFAEVRVKNSKHGALNEFARFRRVLTNADVLASPVVSSPLRLLDFCSVSDGAAALVLTRANKARTLGREHIFVSAVCTPTPDFPNTALEIGALATDSMVSTEGKGKSFSTILAQSAYEEAGIGIDDVDIIELYDISTAAELDWYEAIGLCSEGMASSLIRERRTQIGGKKPVNPSGGLLSFGEAVGAQVIAQVCDVTSQLRGRCGARQVEGATVGLALCQAIMGNGASIILSK